MGSSSKGSGGKNQFNYGGDVMSEADAMAKYQADMAAARAPTTTGATPADLSTPARVETGGIPTLPTINYGNSAYNPAIPAQMVWPTAPTPASSRDVLASAVNKKKYRESNKGGLA